MRGAVLALCLPLALTSSAWADETHHFPPPKECACPSSIPPGQHFSTPQDCPCPTATPVALTTPTPTTLPPVACQIPMDMEKPHAAGDLLACGWEIKAATPGPKATLVLQKGVQAVWCEMKDERTELKGVPQVLTASCAMVR